MRCARCSTSRTVIPRSRIAAERLEDDVDDLRREAERRLVEQEHVRRGDERARDRELLLLPAGERAGLRRRELARRREQLVDRVERLVAPPGSRRPREPEPEVLLTVSSAKIRRPSGTSATPAARHGLGRRPRASDPPSRMSPARSGTSAHDRVERRGLARAVRADQADDLARPPPRATCRARPRRRRSGRRGPSTSSAGSASRVALRV